MKKMIVMLLAFAPLFVMAQNASKKTPEERIQKHTDKMATDLDLSEAQKAKVAAINKKYGDEAMENHAARKAEKDARRAEAQKRADARDQELKAVLTEAQYAKHLEIKAAQKEKHQAKVEKWKSKKGKNKQ
jgi:hypothetical protein